MINVMTVYSLQYVNRINAIGDLEIDKNIKLKIV